MSELSGKHWFHPLEVRQPKSVHDNDANVEFVRVQVASPLWMCVNIHWRVSISKAIYRVAVELGKAAQLCVCVYLGYPVSLPWCTYVCFRLVMWVYVLNAKDDAHRPPGLLPFGQNRSTWVLGFRWSLLRCRDRKLRRERKKPAWFVLSKKPKFECHRVYQWGKIKLISSVSAYFSLVRDTRNTKPQTKIHHVCLIHSAERNANSWSGIHNYSWDRFSETESPLEFDIHTSGCMLLLELMQKVCSKPSKFCRAT